MLDVCPRWSFLDPTSLASPVGEGIARSRHARSAQRGSAYSEVLDKKHSTPFEAGSFIFPSRSRDLQETSQA